MAFSVTVCLSFIWFSFFVSLYRYIKYTYKPTLYIVLTFDIDYAYFNIFNVLLHRRPEPKPNLYTVPLEDGLKESPKHVRQM
jgi:hypothetical protein